MKLKQFIKKWVIRFAKFSMIGTLTWGIATLIYTALFNFIGEWAWIITLFTGVIEFSLITVFNVKKKGKMFDSCQLGEKQNV